MAAAVSLNGEDHVVGFAELLDLVRQGFLSPVVDFDHFAVFAFNHGLNVIDKAVQLLAG